MPAVIYVRTTVDGMACIDEADITMRARGTVKVEDRTTKWKAEFGTTWEVKFEKEMRDAEKIAKEIAGVLGEVNIPHHRTTSYERDRL